MSDITSIVCFAYKQYNLSKEPFWRQCAYEFIIQNYQHAHLPKNAGDGMAGGV